MMAMGMMKSVICYAHLQEIRNRLDQIVTGSVFRLLAEVR